MHNNEGEEELSLNDEKHKEKKEEVARQMSPKPYVKVITGVCGFFLLIFLTVSILCTSLRVSLSEENFESRFNDIDLNEIHIGDISDEYDNISDYLYDICKKQKGWENLRKSDFENILEEIWFRDFIFDTVNDYRGYFLGEDTGNGVTPSKIVDFIEQNESKIERVLKKAGFEVKVVFDYDAIEDELEKRIGTGLSISRLEENNKSTFSMAKTILSPVFIIIMWVSSFVLAIILFIISYKKIYFPMKFCGIFLTIAGAIGLIGVWVAKIVFSGSSKSIPALVLSLFSGNILIYSLIVFVLGVLLLVGGILLKYFKKKKLCRE